jgi:serine/threonine protein kinase
MDSENPFQEGDVLVGKYRLERLIGTGGMGIVYAATQLELDRRVAIKLLRPESFDSETVIARILVEARATARLQNPHVAKLLDVGRLESNAPFLVMELLEGRNLHDVLLADGPRSVVQAVKYVLETCEALAEAHHAGIVHRDLKPANLFLTRDTYGEPCIKVLDFGISKFLDPSDTKNFGLTDSRSLIGSPIYMSPEQMRSARDVDNRTDIWSLGTLLFELLAGRPVWNGQSLSELCAQVTRDDCPTLDEVCPGISPALSAIVARCLQKDPAERFQDVADLALALKPYALPADHSTVARVLQLSGRTSREELLTTQESVSTSGREEPSVGRTLEGSVVTASSPKTRRKMLPISLGLLILLVCAISSAWLFGARRAVKTPSANAVAQGSTLAGAVPPAELPSTEPPRSQPSPPLASASSQAPSAANSTMAANPKPANAIARSRPASHGGPVTPRVDPMSIRE